VTVCAINRAPVFGEIVDGQVQLNAVGKVVCDIWLWLPVQYPYVTLDEWCVMPDHLHGILALGPPVDTLVTDGDVPKVRRKPSVGRFANRPYDIDRPLDQPG